MLYMSTSTPTTTPFIVIIIYDIIINLSHITDHDFYRKVSAAATINVPEPNFEKRIQELIHVQTALKWPDAKEVCDVDYGGHLVKYNTQEEIDNIVDFTNTHYVGNHFWIGLQWSNGYKVWNDGQCTPISNLDHYKDSSDSSYNVNQQCYASHGEGVMEWEAFSCEEEKHFVCERYKVSQLEYHKITFYVILVAGSDVTACGLICVDLKDCFMASAIPDGCVVGIASNTSDTTVLKVGARDDLLNQHVNSRVTFNGNSPPSCKREGFGSQPPTSNTTYLFNHTLINITNCLHQHQIPSPPNIQTIRVTATQRETVMTSCLSASPLVSTQHVTQTVTETAYETATTKILHHSCTQQPAVSTTTVSSCHPIAPTTAHSPIATMISGNDDDLRSSIYESLNMDKDKLSKTVRAKTSAENRRVSSVAIGFSFFLMSSVFVGVIIVSDFSNVYHAITTRMVVNLKSRVFK